LQSLEKQLQQIDLTLEENGGRIGVMDEHLKNVQQEITYTESRVSAPINNRMDTPTTDCPRQMGSHFLLNQLHICCPA
jgi:hypothetical protein